MNFRDMGAFQNFPDTHDNIGFYQLEPPGRVCRPLRGNGLAAGKHPRGSVLHVFLKLNFLVTITSTKGFEKKYLSIIGSLKSIISASRCLIYSLSFLFWSSFQALSSGIINLESGLSVCRQN